MWGLHNDTLTEELIKGGFVSIGWDEIGDLSLVGAGRDEIKAELARANPDDSQGRINSQAGVVYRFAHVVSVGDIVVAPYRPNGTINIGKISGPYFYAAEAPTHRHRRNVEWLKIGIARNEFSQSALYELGSAITLFEFKRHRKEVSNILDGHPAESADPAAAVEDVSREMPTADRIEQATMDYVLEAVSKRIKPNDFEELTADVLRAIGYRARVTPYSQDGGVDVIAHKDPLGIEPPHIVVQCKQRVGSVSAPEVQQLIGAGLGSLLLYVTTGTFTKDALTIERQNPKLRLISGVDFVDLLITNYTKLPEKWRKIVPLRTVFAVDISN